MGLLRTQHRLLVLLVDINFRVLAAVDLTIFCVSTGRVDVELHAVKFFEAESSLLRTRQLRWLVCLYLLSLPAAVCVLLGNHRPLDIFGSFRLLTRGELNAADLGIEVRVQVDVVIL